LARERINRTLTLRTAISNSDFGRKSGGPGSLEKLVRQLHGALTTIEKRRAKFQDYVVECRHAEENSKGVFLHIAAYTPDDKIAVVPSAGKSRSADLRLMKPPENSDFLDGDLMAFIKGDDVSLCRSGLSEAALTAYIFDLGVACGIDSKVSTFSLMKRADGDQLAMIKKEGIKSISFNGVAHAATVSRTERDTVTQRLIGSVLTEVKALVGLSEEVPEDAENLKVEVSFSFDKRNGTMLDQKELSMLANQVLRNEEDGFTIRTYSGRTIRADDVAISKVVSLKPFGKSADYQSAWDELSTFYRELSVRPGEVK
jgi:hypothetical protein